MYSLLQKKPKIQLEPYPHVVIEDALPWDLYEALENTFPEDLVLGTQPYDNGICYRMKADMLLKMTYKFLLCGESSQSIIHRHSGSTKSMNCLETICQQY